MRIKRSCATIMSLCMAFSAQSAPVFAANCVHAHTEECKEVCEHSCSEESGCLTQEPLGEQEDFTENASALPGEGAMMEEEQSQPPEQGSEGVINAPDAGANESEGTAAPAGEEPQEMANVPQILMSANAGETPVSVPVLLANASGEVADETALTDALADDTIATVKLKGNIEISSALTVSRTVTLDLNGYVLRYENSSNKGSVIEVGSGGDLTITDSGTDGKITGGTGTQVGHNIFGGGVYISGGKLTLEKGSIADCSVTTDGNNKVEYAYGGGVYISGGGELTMTGGSIENCRANGQGSGFRAYGGGVWIADGKFTMKGGSIDGCSVTYASSACGGGVGLTGANGTFIMEGGSITNCTTSGLGSGNGGGVCVVSGATFQMSGGSITNCKAAGYPSSTGEGFGGGVSVASATFTMSGNALVETNKADRDIGNDIYNAGTTDANGGTVKGTVYNEGSGTITNSGKKGTIFEGEVRNAGTIKGGEFHGTVTKEGTGMIQGGTFANQTPPQDVDYCTVTFKEDGSATAGVLRYVVRGKTVIPPTLTRAGYEVSGWYKEGESAAFDFTTPIADTTTLTAKWNAIDYSVNVSSSDGGTATASKNTANVGNSVTLTATPDEGYQFKKWEVTPSSVSIQNNSFAMPASNVTIKAIFEKQPAPTPTPSGGSSGGGSGRTYHKMTFETNGGSTIRVVNAARGDIIDLTKYNPTREGYEFIGWFADADLTQKITEIKLTGNMTVYAGWRGIEPVEPETPIEPEKPAISNPFADVQEENWFYDDVLFAYEQGLFIGISENMFVPQAASTRAQIAAIFYRMEGSPAAEGGGSFADVTQGAWFYDAVTWAEKSGILSGYGNGSFGANDPVTREQLAAIFYRYAQFKGLDTENAGDLDAFADKNAASAWAQTALSWAVERGLVSGKGDSRLDPKGTATRAELAAMLHRFAQQTEQ